MGRSTRHARGFLVLALLAVAGCGSSASKPKTPIAAFNDCIDSSPAGLANSSPPTKKVFELITRTSDNLAIGTVFLIGSRSLAERFASDARHSDSQLALVRAEYVVTVYNQLPRRYATVIASCAGKLV